MTFVFARTIAAIAGSRIRLDSTGDVTGTQHLPTWLDAAVLLPISVIWLSFAVHQVLSVATSDG